MREIRTLRAMWRALETGSRQVLNGHEGGNPGHKPRMSLRATAPVLDPTRRRTRPMVCFVNVASVDHIIYSIFQRFNLVSRL